MPQIMDELDKYRQMRGPMPDIGRAMEEAARQLGLIDLVDQPEPNPWLAQANIVEPGANDRSSVPWRVRDPDLWGKLRTMQGGYQNPWPEDPQEWLPWEGGPMGQNSMNMESVSSSLMDLTQTPGFKIGLGGTAALIALLEYLGANALEEISP